MEAMITLFVLTLLYKENPLFRFAEHLMIGCGAGYAVILGYDSLNANALVPISKGQISLVIPILLGLLLFARFTSTPYPFRYPIAIIIGVGLGLAMRGMIEADVMNQLIAVAKPLSSNSIDAFGQILQIVALLSSLIFFFFTVEHTGIIGAIAHLGRWSLMVAFGFMFSNAALTRFSWVISRYIFLLTDWLGLL
jgi:hypothetical protein